VLESAFVKFKSLEMYQQNFGAGLDADGLGGYLFGKALLAVKLFFFVEELFEVKSFDAVVQRCVFFDIEREIIKSFRAGIVRLALQAGDLVLKFATEQLLYKRSFSLLDGLLMYTVQKPAHELMGIMMVVIVKNSVGLFYCLYKLFMLKSAACPFRRYHLPEKLLQLIKHVKVCFVGLGI